MPDNYTAKVADYLIRKLINYKTKRISKYPQKGKAELHSDS